MRDWERRMLNNNREAAEKVCMRACVMYRIARSSVTDRPLWIAPIACLTDYRYTDRLPYSNHTVPLLLTLRLLSVQIRARTIAAADAETNLRRCYSGRCMIGDWTHEMLKYASKQE